MNVSVAQYVQMLERLDRNKARGPHELVATPVEEESDLHEDIFSACRRRGWIALHGSMAERTHRTKGEPDFVILANDGRVILVEAKSRKGKLSPAQNAMRVHAETLGHTIHVVHSLEEFLNVL